MLILCFALLYTVLLVTTNVLDVPKYAYVVLLHILLYAPLCRIRYVPGSVSSPIFQKTSTVLCPSNNDVLFQTNLTN